MINAERSHYLFANSQLPSAFQRGETHADRYETSAIMAIDPSLVNEERRKALPCLPISLVDKLFKEKLTDFLEFGMEESYCGDPASATREEGEKILWTLSRLVVEDAEKLLLGTRNHSILNLSHIPRDLTQS
jgi:creatinine amidohydrolase